MDYSTVVSTQDNNKQDLNISNTEKSGNVRLLITVMSFLLILFVVILFVIFYVLTEKNEVEIVEDPVITTTPEEIKSPFAFYNTENLETSLAKVYTESADCQPENFDPKLDKFSLVDQDGTPSKLYEIEGFEGGKMMINGWLEEGEDKIELPTPYDVTIYHFGCASSWSYVIDLEKNGTRQALYTQVLDFSFSDDGENLYLSHLIDTDTEWVLVNKIVNIFTEEESEIANLECVNSSHMWQNDRLLTYNIKETGEEYPAEFCMWDNKAELLTKFDLNVAIGAASKSFLAEQVGLLPDDSDIIYTYSSNGDYCSLYLVDFNNEEEFKTIDIAKKTENNYYCASPAVEFDFSKTNFNNGIIKYRKELLNTDWTDWESISIDNIE